MLFVGFYCPDQWTVVGGWWMSLLVADRAYPIFKPFWGLPDFAAVVVAAAAVVGGLASVVLLC